MQVTPRILWYTAPTDLADNRAANLTPGELIRDVKIAGAPSFLMTAAPLSELRAWYGRNPWALHLPLLRFVKHDDKEPIGKRRHYLDERGLDDYVAVDGLGPNVALEDYRSSDPSERVDVTVAVARSLAERCTGKGWEVLAEHSAGALAIGVALAKGTAIAQTSSMPGPMTNAMINAYGVALRVIANAQELERETRSRIAESVGIH